MSVKNKCIISYSLTQIAFCLYEFSLLMLTWKRWSLLGWRMWSHACCPPLALEKDTWGYWIPARVELISCTHKQAVRKNIQGMCCPALTHPLAEPWGEVVKNEVGVGLRHGAYVGNIVPHYHVVKSEISCWAKWQMAHHQAICKYIRTNKTKQNNKYYGQYWELNKNPKHSIINFKSAEFSYW